MNSFLSSPIHWVNLKFTRCKWFEKINKCPIFSTKKMSRLTLYNSTFIFISLALFTEPRYCCFTIFNCTWSFSCITMTKPWNKITHTYVYVYGILRRYFCYSRVGAVAIDVCNNSLLTILITLQGRMKIMILAASCSGCAHSPSQKAMSRAQDTVITKASKTWRRF